MNQRLLMVTVAVVSAAANAHVVWQVGQKDGTGNAHAVQAPKFFGCYAEFKPAAIPSTSISTLSKCWRSDVHPLRDECCDA